MLRRPLTNATNNFRASLLPLFIALPSAATSTVFASLRSDSDRAFVWGLCFGDATASECRGCLSVTARNLSSGCGNTTRRAGISTDRCFIAHTDTDAPAEDAFRSRVLLRGEYADPTPAPTAPVPDAEATYDSDNLHAWLVDMAQSVAHTAATNVSGPRMLATADDAGILIGCPVNSTVHMLAQGARDHTAAECARCLQESARPYYVVRGGRQSSLTRQPDTRSQLSQSPSTHLKRRISVLCNRPAQYWCFSLKKYEF